jgi:hypothetical protein
LFINDPFDSRLKTHKLSGIPHENRFAEKW